MKATTLSALNACGRERVFENSLAPQIAIRWNSRAPREDLAERWCLGNGATQDEAGIDAAAQFAARLRAESQALASWAERVESAITEAKR